MSKRHARRKDMKKIHWSFWGLLLALTALWLLADTLWPAQGGYFAFRTVWVQYSGVLAMALMSVAMVLAFFVSHPSFR